MIKFHQNQPKIAPVLEKSTLLANFALAPFEKNDILIIYVIVSGENMAFFGKIFVTLWLSKAI